MPEPTPAMMAMGLVVAMTVAVNVGVWCLTVESENNIVRSDGLRRCGEKEEEGFVLEKDTVRGGKHAGCYVGSSLQFDLRHLVDGFQRIVDQ